MVERGERFHSGKDDLLLLDFLWHTDRHELVHPANLIAEDIKVSKTDTNMIKKAGEPVDIKEI